MRFRNVATVLCLIVAALILIQSRGRSSAQTERGKALESLVAAERAFSRTSEDKGIREAFLTWLAPDAVVFRPGPVPGRPVYEKMDPANPAILTWQPEVAEVSSSGDLGYTSGPYQLRPQRGAEPTAFGHYVSVWKKQPDGAWKVILDIGIQHGRPEPSAAAPEVATPAADKNAEALSPERLRNEEHAFGRRAGSIDSEAAAKGLRKALAEFATDDIRLYRAGKLPSRGRRSIEDLIPSGAGRVAPRTQRRTDDFQVGMAWSGDLAYSFGRSEFRGTPTTAETTSFLRIWRKEASGVWRICLDIEIPVQPEGKKAG